MLWRARYSALVRIRAHEPDGPRSRNPRRLRRWRTFCSRNDAHSRLGRAAAGFAQVRRKPGALAQDTAGIICLSDERRDLGAIATARISVSAGTQDGVARSVQ